MDLLKKIALEHILAEPGAVAVIAYALGRVDDIILFTLRFFPAATIKAELDTLDALAKARVDADAAKAPKP